MSILVIDGSTARQLLPIPECIDVMAGAMRALSRGDVAMPPRAVVPIIDEGGYLGSMAGSCRHPRSFGIKVLSILPHNSAANRPVLQGAMLVFDAETGAPAALIDGTALTAIRTPAVTGLATRLLARSSARTAAIFGCGVQAAGHLDALCAVRALEHIVVWARSAASAMRFCREHGERLGLSIRFEPDASVAAQADIICTTTSAREPILRGAWVRPGTHVNLIGSHDAASAEADGDLIAAAAVYVDRREFAVTEAGEIVAALKAGAITAASLRGEIGELLDGSIPGRSDDREITVFKSLGVVAQDLVAAEFVIRAARARGAGVRCEF